MIGVNIHLNALYPYRFGLQEKNSDQVGGWSMDIRKIAALGV